MYFPGRSDFYHTNEEVCSNFDGIINQTVVDELIHNNCWSEYPAWNWWGKVWHNGEKFHIEVRFYGSVVGTYDAATMEELRQIVCENHGQD